MLNSSRNISRLQGESFVNNLSTTDENARIDVETNGIGARGLAEPFLMSKSSTRMLKLHEDCWKKAYNRESDINRYFYDISINRHTLLILKFSKSSFQSEYQQGCYALHNIVIMNFRRCNNEFSIKT